jgi:hypothetical protein
MVTGLSLLLAKPTIAISLGELGTQLLDFFE